MALYKARQFAIKEFEALPQPCNIPDEINSYSYQPHNQKIGTAAKILYDIQ